LSNAAANPRSLGGPALNQLRIVPVGSSSQTMAPVVKLVVFAAGSLLFRRGLHIGWSGSSRDANAAVALSAVTSPSARRVTSAFNRESEFSR